MENIAYLTVIKKDGVHHAVLTTGKPLQELPRTEHVFAFQMPLTSIDSLEMLWQAAMDEAKTQRINVLSFVEKKG
jgi:hypothetical protein